MVLSGDFRLCLSVIPGAGRAEIVNAALNRSPLWPFFKIMQLSEKMRVRLKVQKLRHLINLLYQLEMEL
jgi:DNA polymerase III delta subunit